MGDEPKGLRYADAGVDIGAATEAFNRMKTFVNKTFNDNVLRDIGSFGAMLRLDTGAMEEPVLVSSVDGVGTKLKVAFLTGRHDTVGIDLVSHCVNDILVQGAKPLFFMDYLACGHLDPEVVVEVIQGVASGCRFAGCPLIGGETAEMPDMYKPGEYDLAGTIVGLVDRSKIVDGSGLQPGDVLIGLESSGLHTNGYSLARKVCFDHCGLSVDDPMPGAGKTVGEALLEPHRSYAKVVQILMKIVEISGMAHITGGGLTDNLPRMLNDGLGIEVEAGAWPVPPIFRFLKEAGSVDDEEMLHTFNMGVGYVLAVRGHDATRALHHLDQGGETAHIIGTITENAPDRVTYRGRLNYGASD